MRIAEHNLDTFWRAVDEELLRKNAVSPRLEEILKERNLHRTAEYREPPKAQKHSDYTVADLLKPLSEVYLERERLTEETISRKERGAPKGETKTRGIAHRRKNDDEATEVPSLPAEEVQPIFRLDKRALKAFKTLFFVPSVSAQPGEVAWNDFLHALISVGFSAEKLYGSVWQFTPTNLDAERSIQFHEPHPSGKLSFTEARRFGRRLNRAYGWHGGMFVAAGSA